MATLRVHRLAPPLLAGAGAALFGVAVALALAVDVRLGVALALAAVGVPIALVDPPLVLALWAGLSVFSRHPAFGMAMTGAGLLAFGAWVAHARADPARVRAALRPHRRLLTLLALLLAWVTLSQAWARDPARAGAEAVYWYINGAAVVVLLTSLRTPRDVRLVVAAVVCAVVASVALGLAGVDLGGAADAAEAATSSEGRLQGTAGDPNFMAAFIVPAIVLAIVLASAAETGWRLLLPAAVGFLVVGLAATMSRGGMLAFLVVLAAAVVVMRGRRAAVLAVAAAALLVGAVWISANPVALERIMSADEDRGSGREDIWLVARRMSADHPVTGVGLDNFRVRSPEYVRLPGSLDYVELIVERPHVVHNTYLQMLAETGAVGLGLFLAFVVTALASAGRAARMFDRTGRRRLALLSRGVLLAGLGLLTAAFFITAQSTAFVWTLLALGPALLGIATLGYPSGGVQRPGTAPGPG
jgi:putative inorganic carbon (HCO3(-)) transporter